MPKFTSLKRRFPHRHYPFSDPLLKFMEAEPTFYASLKLANWRRFKTIPRIITSHTPTGHSHSQDEIIGVWYFDLEGTGVNGHPFFKQDFIVNIGRMDREFHSYTVGFPTNQYVHQIGDFFNTYGLNGQYYHRGSRWEHHYLDVADLPNDRDLKSWGRSLRIQLQITGRCSIKQFL
mgnify:CR=1 FL=1